MDPVFGQLLLRGMYERERLRPAAFALLRRHHPLSQSKVLFAMRESVLLLCRLHRYRVCDPNEERLELEDLVSCER